MIRGDEEGDYTLSADFTGILLPFGDTVSGHFETADPFHVWGPSAVKLIVEPQNTAQAGALYHLRLSMENVTDEPLPSGALDPAHVYNAAIELLEGGKQNFIYAPNQQLMQMKGDLAPGETFSVDYFLIPCISGSLVLDQSYVLRTGGNAEFATELRAGHKAPYPGLTLTASRNGDQVTLTRESVAGAASYRIYTVRPDLLMSTVTERVGETSDTSITLTESGGPQSYIVTVVDASDVALDSNGQASVTFTPAEAGSIAVIIHRDGTELVRTTITAVAVTDPPPVTSITVEGTGYGAGCGHSRTSSQPVRSSCTATGPVSVRRLTAPCSTLQRRAAQARI